MICCKYCGSPDRVKNGRICGKQRYLCKACRRAYTVGDRRVKYDQAKKMKVLSLYLEGVGIRSIERLEGVSNPLIITWIRQCAIALKAKLTSVDPTESTQEIALLALDELFSYCKKN